MNTDRHSQAEQKDLIVDPIERARQEAKNGVHQFEMVLEMIQSHISPNKKPFILKSSVILRLQEAALRGIHPLAGTFRNTAVSITGSRHAPPEPLTVADEITDLCSYVNENWDKRDALHLAAYLLWKLNWIHPFADGNGRTARATSYLVMSIKLDSVLRGTPTIPEQIANDKGPYYDALEAADVEWAKGVVGVEKLEQMLEAMLQRQLLGLPTLGETAQRQLTNTLDARLKRAPSATLTRVFGTVDIANQLWAIGDHLILQVGTKIELEASERRQAEFGSPFPKLLAVGGASGTVKISGDENILEGRDYVAGEGYAFSLTRDAAIALKALSVSWMESGKKLNWRTDSALYVVRFGKNITADNFYKWFDTLLARQLAGNT